jgi:hypothetical protein
MAGIDFNLTNSASYFHGMGWFRKEVSALRQNPNRFGPLPLMARLHAPDNPGKTITVLMQPRDLYLIGVKNQFSAIYFKDYTGPKLAGINRSALDFTGNDMDLGPYSSLSISRRAIESAVWEIAEWKSAKDMTSRDNDKLTPEARHLLMMRLIIAEAARFQQIEKAVGQALDGEAITLSNDAVQDMVNDGSARRKRGGAESPIILTHSA